MATTHRNAPLTPEGRTRLIERCRTRPIAHVAAEMGISRATASKWVNRYKQFGELGLVDRSSTPHRQPTATPGRLVNRIETMRRERNAIGRADTSGSRPTHRGTTGRSSDTTASSPKSSSTPAPGTQNKNAPPHSKSGTGTTTTTDPMAHTTDSRQHLQHRYALTTSWPPTANPGFTPRNERNVDRRGRDAGSQMQSSVALVESNAVAARVDDRHLDAAPVRRFQTRAVVLVTLFQ